LLQRLLFRRRADADAGVVNQHVQPLKFGNGALYDRFPVCLAGDVVVKVKGPPALSLDAPCDRRTFLIFDVSENHCRALTGEHAG
jgi:hypothetical protein